MVGELGRVLDVYEEQVAAPAAGEVPEADERPRPPGRAVPALRDGARGRLLRGLRDELLPALPDRGPDPQGPAPLAAAQVTRARRRHQRARGVERPPAPHAAAPAAAADLAEPRASRPGGRSRPSRAGRCEADAPRAGGHHGPRRRRDATVGGSPTPVARRAGRGARALQAGSRVTGTRRRVGPTEAQVRGVRDRRSAPAVWGAATAAARVPRGSSRRSVSYPGA